jgi:hypothetical protein
MFIAERFCQRLDSSFWLFRPPLFASTSSWFVDVAISKPVTKTFPYVPLDPKGWRLSMGLRPLEMDEWLQIDGRYDEERRLKAALLVSSRDVVVATQIEGDEASQELLSNVLSYLAEHHPDISRTVEHNEHPLVAASRLVQEDLCVLVKSDTWRLQSACVCFPSRWELAKKIGATLDDIHSPVPLYDDQLARPTNAFFDRLTPDRSFWRLNWTLLDSPDLHQPNAIRTAPSGTLDDWYFRVERQTLRQLPLTKAIIFTIRTYVATASSLREHDPQFVSALLHSLDTAPTETQEYKGWVGVATHLRDSL